MGKTHKKLAFEDREVIFGLVKEGLGVREIARYLGRSPSTISAELNRNGMSIKTYSLSAAQVDRNVKASLKGRKSKLEEGKQPLKSIKKWIIDAKWSPEQVSGRLKIKYKNNPKNHVSHETIYKYIYSISDTAEKDKYIKSLRRKRRKRKPRKSTKTQRGPISNPISIHERPSEVALRIIAGHWEGDLIVGKDHQSAIGTLVERTTRYTIIVKFESDKFSENVVKAFAEDFRLIPEWLKKSFTYDRGAEMAQHELFTELTGMPVFFADPGCPGQRGTNENTNGLIRQFYPKKTNFVLVSKEELKQVEDLLNQRPRKILGFKTPTEMMKDWAKGPEPPWIKKHRPLSGEESGGDLVPRQPA